MRTLRLTLVLLVAVSSLQAQGGRAPSFRFERAITARRGPQRLAIDLPVLIGSRPFTVVGGDSGRSVAEGGLGDLRLFDEAGREVPYLLIALPPERETWVPGRVLGVPRTKTTSGFEVDLDAMHVIDRVRIDGLPPPFLKRVRIEASGDRRRWTVLLAQTTLFDLPAQQLRQIELVLPRGSYRYIRAIWDDTSSALVPLPPSVSARLVRKATVPPVLTTEVPAARVASEPGRSRYRLDLPGPRLPIVAIEPQVDAPYLLRDVTVSESRLANGRLAPFVLGSGRLRRVVRDELTASSMAVGVAAPTESQLDLSIADGDNPPLTIARAVVRFAELPWIYFDHAGGPLVARWGDRRLSQPSYDLEAARPSVAIDKVPDAAWGEPHPLAPAEPTTPPPPMPNTGAPIDADRFRYSRSIVPGSGGLVAVPLDAAVLAHTAGGRTSFADVRVADDENRQVPYLIEQREEPLVIDLALERRDAPASARSSGSRVRSFYRVRLPYENLPPWTLALATTAAIFDRQVTLGAERPADARHRDAWIQTMASTRWVHADRNKPAPALTFGGITVEATELLIVVDEGDNSPLPLASARLLLPSFRLRLFREPGATLRLVYGRDDIAAPSYDLALLSASVLGDPAREVALGPEMARGASTATTALASPRVFWTVLVVAVILMLGVLARLITRAT